jgi:hypothetical protein
MHINGQHKVIVRVLVMREKRWYVHSAGKLCKGGVMDIIEQLAQEIILQKAGSSDAGRRPNYALFTHRPDVPGIE